MEAAEAERRASAALDVAAKGERRATTALNAAAQWEARAAAAEARALEAEARLRGDNQRTEVPTSSREIAVLQADGATPADGAAPPDATMSDRLVRTRAAAEVWTRVLAAELASLEASSLEASSLEASSLEASSMGASRFGASGVGASRVEASSAEASSVGTLSAEASSPEGGEALPPAAPDGVTAPGRPLPLTSRREPRRVSFDLAASKAARPLPLTNLTNLTNLTTLTNLSPPSLRSPFGRTAGTPAPRKLPSPRQLQLGRRPMFASPPPCFHAPSFAIYQGEGGVEGGERHLLPSTPHTAEQPAATAVDGAVAATTPPLQFGYARRAMALALGPNPHGAAAAAAMIVR